MTSLEMVKGIIFDLDDTLYRSDVWVSNLTRVWLKEIGLDELATCSDEELGQAFQVARTWLNEFMLAEGVQSRWSPSHDLWVEYGKRILSSLGVTEELDRLASEMTEKWEATVVPWQSTLIPSCKQVLEELHSRGYRLGLASNRWENPSGILKRDSIFDLFAAVEHSMVPGYKKPSPYMMRCVFIGDFIELDVEAARRAQMTPILITWERPDEAKKASQDLLVIDHIEALLDMFR
ncbi:MAG: HAD family hydrolase [Candidatus Thorarchaeota archaeon]|jgi:phosphoglycolate phosphatase-like HAD superfamily hydrolase